MGSGDDLDGETVAVVGEYSRVREYWWEGERWWNGDGDDWVTGSA